MSLSHTCCILVVTLFLFEFLNHAFYFLFEFFEPCNSASLLNADGLETPTLATIFDVLWSVQMQAIDVEAARLGQGDQETVGASSARSHLHAVDARFDMVIPVASTRP